MRIGWIVVALLALNRNAAAEDVTAYVTVGGAACVYPAKSIAGAIFEKAGVRIVWRAPEPSLAGPPRIYLRIELAEGTPDERLPGALAVSYPYRGCAKSITVFFDRVRSLARGVDRESALLAYVLVHEITHVLQGTDRHSEAGVMKAHWTADDRAAIFARRLGFLQEDVLLLRHALAAGWCHNPATLIGRSESGIAVRPE
jgi:hypothetical protein